MNTNKVMLKMLTTLSAVAITVTMSSTSFAAEADAPKKDVMQNVANFMQWNTPVEVLLNGIALPIKAEMINSRIMVPVRSLFESAGATLTWDNKNNAAIVQGSGYSFKVKAGSSAVTVNEKTYTLDHPSTIVGGNLLVSARLASIVLDTPLQWDSASRTLLLNTIKPAQSLIVQSVAFAPYGNIPSAYVSPEIGGQNLSLPVSWSGGPEGTKSYAVVVYDASPIADQFVHYTVVDIPANTQELKEAAADNLAAGKKVIGYYGMQPPRFSGDHQYRIAVFALDQESIPLPENPLFFEDLEPILTEHALAVGELDGFFKFE